MATLRIVGGEEGEQSIELADGVLQIGRARDNDIVLTGAEKGVSRVHAELRFENGRYVVVDLQSQNGTWVNGRRVAGEGHPRIEGAAGYGDPRGRRARRRCGVVDVADRHTSNGSRAAGSSP